MRESSPWLRSTPYEPPQAQHTWFFRATAISSSWLVLLGYTFFAITLTAPRNSLRWSADVLAALGGIALGSGYIGGLIAFWFSRALSFRLDNIVLPLLLSSVGGLFELVLNYALHTSIPVSGTYIYVPLALACISTLLLAGAGLFINTKVKIRKAIEASQKRQLELSQDPSGLLYTNRAPTPSIYTEPPSATSTSATPFLAHQQNSYPHPHSHTTSSIPTHQAFAPPSPSPHSLATIPLPPPLRHMSSTEMHATELNIPSDEAQRRQLLRLLIAKEQQEHPDHPTGTPANPSPEPSGASSTYRIDWPGATSSDDESDNEFTKINNLRRGTTRIGLAGGVRGEVPQFPPPPGRNEARKDGEITNRWSLGNLLGGRERKAVVPEEARVVRATTVGVAAGDVKMERERRRREIERGGLQEGGGGWRGGGEA